MKLMDAVKQQLDTMTDKDKALLKKNYRLVETPKLTEEQMKPTTGEELVLFVEQDRVQGIADFFGHDAEDYINQSRWGLGLHAPFRVSLHTMKYELEQLDRYLDTYIEALNNQNTLEDLERVIWSTERAYRAELAVILITRGDVDPTKFPINGWWEFLTHLWRDSEAMREKMAQFSFLFNLVPATKALVRELPKKGPIKIYRGGHPDGFSWTLSRDKAVWFANRFGDKQPVCEKTITRDEALFYSDDRNEQEVVLKTILKLTKEEQ